jgi:hypothetical protein
MAAGSQDACHFGNRRGPRRHVAQAEGDGDRVEGRVAKREARAVGVDEAACALFLLGTQFCLRFGGVLVYSGVIA